LTNSFDALPMPLPQIVALQLLSTQLAEVLAAVHNAAGAMLQLCCSRCIVSCLVSQLIKVVSGRRACLPQLCIKHPPAVIVFKGILQQQVFCS
jgi:hypothetical protein